MKQCPLYFKVPNDIDLVIRLKQKILRFRDRRWTNYVNEMSLLYQMPTKKLEEAQKAERLDQYDRKFLLIQKMMSQLDSASLKGNYAYILDSESHQVWLVIPHSAHAIFEPVSDSQAASRIRNMILQKTDEVREASFEDMDDMLAAFYGEDAESPLETPEYLIEKN